MKTTTSLILGEILAEKRTSLKMTQAELGAHLGLTQSAWCRVEVGDNALAVDSLLVIADVLKVKASELLRDLDRKVKWAKRTGVKVSNVRSRS